MRRSKTNPQTICFVWISLPLHSKGPSTKYVHTVQDKEYLGDVCILGGQLSTSINYHIKLAPVCCCSLRPCHVALFFPNQDACPLPFIPTFDLDYFTARPLTSLISHSMKSCCNYCMLMFYLQAKSSQLNFLAPPLRPLFPPPPLGSL